MTSSPPRAPTPLLLSLSEVCSATDAPFAAVRRCADQKMLSPITPAAAVEYDYPGTNLERRCVVEHH